MRKHGFINIMIILIFSLLMVFASSILYFSNLHFKISKADEKNVQLRISGEDKINRLIYNDKAIEKYIYPYLLKECKNYFKKDWYTIVLDDPIFKENQGDTASINFESIKDHMYINIATKTTYKELSGQTKFKGRIIRRFFESNEAYVSKFNLEESLRSDFELFMDSMKKDLEIYNFLTPNRYTKLYIDSKIVSINIVDNNNILIDHNKLMYKGENLLLLLFNKFNDSCSFIVGSNDDEGLIKLKGIIYIQGDLVINQNFELEGVMIIDNGNIIINTDTKPTIKGILLYRGEKEIKEDLNLIYNKEIVYYHGIHLPNFIDIQEEVIKKY